MSASFEGKTTDNASFRFESASFEQNDASIYGKEGLVERLYQMERSGEVSAKAASDVKMVIEEMDIMQVVTSKDVMRILSCQTTKARQILRIMESRGLIRTIQGKGKGKYILNVSGQ